MQPLQIIFPQHAWYLRPVSSDGTFEENRLGNPHALAVAV